MKQIQTLVKDIYGLMDNIGGDWKPNTVNINAFGDQLSKIVATRSAAISGPPTLRMSNLGAPARKLWYTINHPEKQEVLSPFVRIKFLYGDILEELLLFLAAEAGHKVEHQQKEVNLHGIKGHIDAIIDGHLVDCKSASTFSFKKFAEHRIREDDPFNYYVQLMGYLTALQEDDAVEDKDKASFLVIDKTLGHLTLDTYSRDRRFDFEKYVEDKVKGIAQETPPPLCYEDVPEGKSGNMKLGVQCSYCSFKGDCWPGLKSYMYSKGPVFLTKVLKEPRVEEILVNAAKEF